MNNLNKLDTQHKKIFDLLETLKITDADNRFKVFCLFIESISEHLAFEEFIMGKIKDLNFKIHFISHSIIMTRLTEMVFQIENNKTEDFLNDLESLKEFIIFHHNDLDKEIIMALEGNYLHQ